MGRTFLHLIKKFIWKRHLGRWLKRFVLIREMFMFLTKINIGVITWTHWTIFFVSGARMK
jgi:hypothetical protein